MFFAQGSRQSHITQNCHQHVQDNLHSPSTNNVALQHTSKEDGRKPIMYWWGTDVSEYSLVRMIKCQYRKRKYTIKIIYLQILSPLLQEQIEGSGPERYILTM